MNDLVEHFFRHEYGRLVASLCRRLGVEHLAMVEDAAQAALAKALSGWPAAGRPDDPSAWLFRVAHNEAVGELRKQSQRARVLDRRAQAMDNDDTAAPDAAPRFETEVGDDLLRMLFVCCDPTLPIESQLAVGLKTLCGFSVAEIAHRLFATEASIYKRLARARQRLRERAAARERIIDAPPEVLAERVPAVEAVIYLLFTEGHLSSHPEAAIRRELCTEAIRLATLLAEHALGARPSTRALLALMHLHRARMDARQDESGGLVLLADQDRGRWDMADIERGMRWLAASAQGDTFSRFHAEASIAAEHCMAPSFEQTRWDKVSAAYALLERSSPSAVHRLNHAIALAQWRGPQAGLDLLADTEPPTWLAGSYMWSAVLADLHRRSGNEAAAARYRNAAIGCAPTPAIRDALVRRLAPTKSSGDQDR